jgi:hypothetical protein
MRPVSVGETPGRADLSHHYTALAATKRPVWLTYRLSGRHAG